MSRKLDNIQNQRDFKEEIDASKPRIEFNDKKCDTVISGDPCSKETGTPPDTLEEIAEAEPESSDSAAENREQDDTTDCSKVDVDKSFTAQLRSTGHNGKATGPRTAEGKQNSSVNATKHGIFSHVTVLKGESKTEYVWLAEEARTFESDANVPQRRRECLGGAMRF